MNMSVLNRIKESFQLLCRNFLLFAALAVGLGWPWIALDMGIW